MHASLIALVSTIATAAAAPGSSDGASSSSTTTVRNTPYAEWPASHFAESCSPGGCFASFNISAPAGYVAGAPAFDVVCHPIYIQQDWLDCDNTRTGQANSRVQSMWTDVSQRGLVKISVAHIWTRESGQRNNASGFAEIDAGKSMFSIPVTMLSAVL
ncbi:hypothetical protein PG993_002868 [Apiospora rasikravindrae]|uniref:Uncharacterized protein n=1 Tax=Apiospora rasikravindrae TaxID=990691 RepID=A0ABR1U0I2_9PEZI